MGSPFPPHPLPVPSSGMRSRFHSATLPSEVADYADEIRLAFLDLGRVLTTESLTGECSPVIDVYENEAWVEIVVDLPGVDPAAIRVTAKGDTVLIVGEKARRRPDPDSSFHLVERDFGRFARVVRVGPACDFARARARLAGGELRLSLPKIADRRGAAIPIAIT